jgi:hypothetical protein
MKTPLTFLLALTFLFLFSGSVFGGVFDKKDESGVFTCNTRSNLYSVDMNEKTITRYSLRGSVVHIYKIVEENEVIVKGKGEKEGEEIILHKHSYLDKKVIELWQHEGNDPSKSRDLCFVGDKKF